MSIGPDWLLKRDIWLTRLRWHAFCTRGDDAHSSEAQAKRGTGGYPPQALELNLYRATLDSEAQIAAPRVAQAADWDKTAALVQSLLAVHADALLRPVEPPPMFATKALPIMRLARNWSRGRRARHRPTADLLCASPGIRVPSDSTLSAACFF